jgi:hypothetical protein
MIKHLKCLDGLIIKIIYKIIKIQENKKLQRLIFNNSKKLH